MCKCEHYGNCDPETRDQEYCIFHKPDKNEKEAREFYRRFLERFKPRKETIAAIGSFYKRDVERLVFEDDVDCTRYVFPVITTDIDFSFERVVFKGNAKFLGAIFEENVISDFGMVSFDNAEFEKEVSFDSVKFNDRVSFDNTKFKDKVSFNNTEFEKEASFNNAEFEKEVSFDNTKFKDKVSFNNTEFEKEASFDNAEFEDKVSISRAEFNDRVSFDNTKFKDKVSFYKIKFSDKASFDNAEFEDKVSISRAEFNDRVSFDNTKFKDKVSFNNTEFEKEASFDNAEFEKEVSFDSVKFNDRVSFDNTKFKDKVSFNNTEFEKEASFDNAEFEKEVSLYRVFEFLIINYENKGKKDYVDKIFVIERRTLRRHKVLRTKKILDTIQNLLKNKDLNWTDLRKDIKNLNIDWIEKYRYKRGTIRKVDYLMLLARATWDVFAAYAGSAVEHVLADFTCRYGTDWKRPIILWVFLVIFVFPFIYCLTHSVSGIHGTKIDSIWNCLYFSVVTATTLGYGDLHPVGWGKAIASAEAIFGMFMWAVFLAIFSRKYMR